MRVLHLCAGSALRERNMSGEPIVDVGWLFIAEKTGG